MFQRNRAPSTQLLNAGELIIADLKALLLSVRALFNAIALLQSSRAHLNCHSAALFVAPVVCAFKMPMPAFHYTKRINKSPF